jgi:exopolysaccharide production protein ExoQ
MPPNLALCIFVFFVLWLFARDRKRPVAVSTSLWIVVIWCAIIGSRPVSLWFGLGKSLETIDDYLDGSPLDRNIFLFLILAGLFVLSRRRTKRQKITSNNSWIFLFYLYIGISALWSDYPFVAFKRWIKDFGNVVMVMVILTEEDPVAAVKAVAARCAYLLIPFSVLFIKYYPELGRTYHQWTWEPAYTGVTIEKNALGHVAFLCGLFLLWDLIKMRGSESKAKNKSEILAQLVLLLMVIWLLAVAQSATSLTCAILGTGILLGFKLGVTKRHVKRLGAYSLAAAVFLLLLTQVVDLRGLLVESLGRDATLTGRTELWDELLRKPINPVLGTGYGSFWLGNRAQQLWDKYWWHPNQAHNGYLETYLNCGLIGVGLLICLLVAAARNIIKELHAGTDYGPARLTLLVVTAVYNWTEAAFNRLDLVWFVLLLVAMERPRLLKVRKVGSDGPTRPSSGDITTPREGRHPLSPASVSTSPFPKLL